MKNKYVKWGLIILLIIILIVVIVLLVQASKPQVQPPVGGGPTPAGGGIGDLLSGVFGPGWFQNIFSGGSRCDTSRPGFQRNGVYNPDKCGTASGFECDPTRPGYNLQGFPDTNCGFGG